MKKIDLIRISERAPEDCARAAGRGKADDKHREVALSRFRALMGQGETLQAAESARRDGLLEEMKNAAGSEYTRLIGLAARTNDSRHYAGAFRIASGFGLGAGAIAEAARGMRRGHIDEESAIDDVTSGSGKTDNG
jgi:hypothetical protein